MLEHCWTQLLYCYNVYCIELYCLNWYKKIYNNSKGYVMGFLYTFLAPCNMPLPLMVTLSTRIFEWLLVGMCHSPSFISHPPITPHLHQHFHPSLPSHLPTPHLPNILPIIQLPKITPPDPCHLVANITPYLPSSLYHHTLPITTSTTHN